MDFKNKMDFKNMYRLKPLNYQKLHTIITIILRNTIASKAIIGLINTFNSKTVTILNL